MNIYDVFDVKIKYFDHKLAEWKFSNVKNVYDFEYDKEFCDLIIKYIANVDIGSNSSYIVSEIKELKFSYGIMLKEQYRTYNLEIKSDTMILTRMKRSAKCKRKYGKSNSFKSNSYKRRGGVKDSN